MAGSPSSSPSPSPSPSASALPSALPGRCAPTRRPPAPHSRGIHPPGRRGLGAEPRQLVVQYLDHHQRPRLARLGGRLAHALDRLDRRLGVHAAEAVDVARARGKHARLALLHPISARSAHHRRLHLRLGDVPDEPPRRRVCHCGRTRARGKRRGRAQRRQHGEGEGCVHVDDHVACGQGTFQEISVQYCSKMLNEEVTIAHSSLSFFRTHPFFLKQAYRYSTAL